MRQPSLSHPLDGRLPQPAPRYSPAQSDSVSDFHSHQTAVEAGSASRYGARRVAYSDYSRTASPGTPQLNSLSEVPQRSPHSGAHGKRGVGEQVCLRE